MACILTFTKVGKFYIFYIPKPNKTKIEIPKIDASTDGSLIVDGEVEFADDVTPPEAKFVNATLRDIVEDVTYDDVALPDMAAEIVDDVTPPDDDEEEIVRLFACCR